MKFRFGKRKHKAKRTVTTWLMKDHVSAEELYKRMR